MRSTRLFLTGGLVAAVLAVGVPAQAAGPTGSAFAISVQATLLSSLKAQVGPLPKASYPAGADNSVVSVDVLRDHLASARVLNASSQLADGTLTSKASIADVSALGLIEAELITAECTSANGVAGGASKLVDVRVGGTTIKAGASGSIRVSDLVQVHVNEQVYAGGKLTVNALRVSVGGKVGTVARAEVILSQAVCSGAAGGGDDNDGENGGGDGGTPTTTTTTANPGDGGPTTTTTAAPGDDDAPATTTTPAANPGITPVANGDDLADTGVGAVVPLAIGGALLLAGGGAALYLVRRRARA